MHYSCMVSDWIAEITFGLRPNFGVRLGLSGEFVLILWPQTKV